MHADRDFDPRQELDQDLSLRSRQAPHELEHNDTHDLGQDLALETLLQAMAAEDPFLRNVAQAALLTGLHTDTETILYRQEIVRDSLDYPAAVRELYGLAVEAIESKRKNYWGFISRYPSGILAGSVDMLETLAGILARLKRVADQQSSRFRSRGFTRLFAMLQSEFDDEYFATVQGHLRELRFKDGILLSAELGEGNAGTGYALHETHTTRPSWLERIIHKQPPAFTFRIHDRDEAGANALSEIRNRGINMAANAVAQSTEHIISFFEMLKTELAFYVGCVNLHDRLASMGAPSCLPKPDAVGARTLRFSELYDVSLALHMASRVVGNTVDADGKNLIIITGANQGGKSSFLRSVGLAQMMMQAGMFVGAEAFVGEICAGLFTHYKREEDVTMNKGKLDEELSRLSDFVDEITPNSTILFNESFAATNEREGSEIATQVADALLEKRVRVFFVTHQYEFAHGFFARRRDDILFLRAERRDDGTRTFKLSPAEPLQTSYGEDVYRSIFGAERITTAP